MEGELVVPHFKGTVREAIRRVGPCSMKEKLVIQDLRRIMSTDQGDIVWSVELWLYLGGIERVTYIRYAQLVKASLDVPEHTMFAFINDRPVENAMEEVKQNHGTTFRPSIWLWEPEEDDETDDEEDIEVEEEVLDASMPPVLSELDKLKDGSAVEQNPAIFSIEEIRRVLASVDLFRELKIGPVNWRLILDCTGLGKKGFTEECVAEQMDELATRKAVFNVHDYEQFLKDHSAETTESARQADRKRVHCSTTTQVSTYSWIKILGVAPELTSLLHMKPILWKNFALRLYLLDIFHMPGSVIKKSFFAHLLPRIRDSVFGLAGRKAAVQLELWRGERYSMITVFHAMKPGPASREGIIRTIENLQEQKILSTNELPNTWLKRFAHRVFSKGHKYFATTRERYENFISGIGYKQGRRLYTIRKHFLAK